MGSLSTELFEEIVSLSSQSLLIVDAATPEPRIVHANPAYLAQCGYTLPALQKVNWRRLIGVASDAPEMAELKTLLESGEGGSLRLPFLGQDGEFWDTGLTIAPLKSARRGKRLRLVQLEFEDRQTVTFTESHPQALRAHSAPRLLTRAQFELLCRRELTRARRDNQPLCLILFSVPEIDVYRATFGELAADSCLRMIGTQITCTFRRGRDICALFDAGSLAVAIVGIDEEQAGHRVSSVEKKVRNLGLHNPRGRQNRYLAVNGVAVLAETDDSLERLFDRALEALQSERLAASPAAAVSG